MQGKRRENEWAKNMFKGRLQKQLVSQSHDSENKLKEGAMGQKKNQCGCKVGRVRR